MGRLKSSHIHKLNDIIMTLDELLPKLDLMRDANENEFRNLSDSDVLDLKQKSAKIELKSDLLTALSIPQSQSAQIDTIVDLNSDFLSVALTYKQLQLFYFEKNEVSDVSLSLYRLESYTKKYEQAKSAFTQLKTYSEQAIKIANVIDTMYG